MSCVKIGTYTNYKSHLLRILTQTNWLVPSCLECSFIRILKYNDNKNTKLQVLIVRHSANNELRDCKVKLSKKLKTYKSASSAMETHIFVLNYYGQTGDEKTKIKETTEE